MRGLWPGAIRYNTLGKKRVRTPLAHNRELGTDGHGQGMAAWQCCNTDEHVGYPPAIVRLKSVGTLEEKCRHRPVQYLNNVLEQDHRAIKRRVPNGLFYNEFLRNLLES